MSDSWKVNVCSQGLLSFSTQAGWTWHVLWDGNEGCDRFHACVMERGVCTPLNAGLKSSTRMLFWFSCLLWEMDVSICPRWLPHCLNNSPGNKQEQEEKKKKKKQLARIRVSNGRQQMLSPLKLGSLFLLLLLPKPAWTIFHAVKSQMIMSSVFPTRPSSCQCLPLRCPFV